MNFLSHYYLLPPAADPLMVMGNSLPDLLHLRSGYRLRKRNRLHIDHHDAIEMGIQYHIATDHVFHQSDYFERWQDFLALKLKARKLNSIPKYLPFYIHVWVEMCIDKCLLARHPMLASDYYLKLAQVSSDQLHHWWITQEFDESEYDSFWDAYQSFIERKFLTSYSSSQGFASVIRAFASRIHKYEINELDLNFLLTCCDELLVKIDDEWNEFWNYLTTDISLHIELEHKADELKS